MNPRQERFCERYIIHLNATQAAIEAGYSEHTAAQMGYENLRKPEIVSRIDGLKAERSQRAKIDADEVLHYLTELYRTSPEDMYVEDEEGRPRLKKASELTRAQWNTIQSVKITDTDTPGRHGTTLRRQLEVRHYPRDKALEMAMRHLALFTDRVEYGTRPEGFTIKMRGLEDKPRGERPITGGSAEGTLIGG